MRFLREDRRRAASSQEYCDKLLCEDQRRDASGLKLVLSVSSVRIGEGLLVAENTSKSEVMRVVVLRLVSLVPIVWMLATSGTG